KQDIQGSIAHVKMLAKQGIIPAGDAPIVEAQLREILALIESGSFEFSQKLEDIHMNIESYLIDKVGTAGARLHTARSRNDQVATDIRLYVRDEIDEMSVLIEEVKRALVKVARDNKGAIMPGFTHMQNAQPVLFAHHLLAYVEMFDRDRGRLLDCRKRLNVCPLGSAALAGSTFPIDRQFVAAELQFDGCTRNSMDGVSDRDFIIELNAALSIMAMHFSRLSEDIILWMSQQFSFIDLGDAFCTGSSIMPQKKNPDIAEITRGKTGRIYGSLMSILTITKGLPLTYNRDLQEDKEGIFDAIDTAKMILAVYAKMLLTLKVKKENMLKSASEPSLMATDLAEWLVKQGMPFRTAHHRVGSLVKYSETTNIPMNELSLEQMQETVPEATEECLSMFSPESAVNARTVFGGTAPQEVERQLLFWESSLA
ncbi:MAG: argininosuccinate lyase, partial [Lentisphaeria bacterium]